jgi:hypothetical protein
MPKRTNDFQRLVYLVRLNLAEGAEVKESVLMRDRLTKRYREVDIVIRGKIGSQSVTVCIECRDHKRVADVVWVDAMKSKHDRLETNVLLLASSSGFTKEAVNVAEKYGIEVITLENQETTNFSELVGPNGSLWQKVYTLSINKVSIQAGEINELPAEVVITMPDNLFYRKDGSEFCQIKDLVEKIIKSERVYDYILHKGQQEHVWFEFVWNAPIDEMGPIYMMKLEPRVLHVVDSIYIEGPCRIEVDRFSMKSARLGSVEIAWGKTNISGHEALAVATFTESGESKLSINIQG